MTRGRWQDALTAQEQQIAAVAAEGLSNRENALTDRGIAHDRRGGGRSSQTWDGNNLDQYADDLAALIETLDLHDAILVGDSAGGGEVTRYLGRHGTSRVAKAVLLSAIPPLMLKTDAKPEGTTMDVFRRRSGPASPATARSTTTISAEPFYGANRPGSQVSQGAKDAFWLMSMSVGVKGAYDCIKVFSESDTTEDLKKIDIPTLVPARRRQPRSSPSHRPACDFVES